MKNYLKKLRHFIFPASRSVSMYQRVSTYFLVMSLTIFVAILLILTFSGVLFNQEKKLEETLALQMESSEREISGHMNRLTGKGIQLSHQISHKLHQIMGREGLTSVSQLNNRPDLLEELQESCYLDLSTAIESTRCSGGYFVLDSTTNTKTDIADRSRSGLYLRLANIATQNSGSSRCILFRGIPSIARKENIEMHNRWNLEFDTSVLPGYHKMLGSNASNPAKNYFWSESVSLTETWEHISILCIPIMDRSNQVCGMCGLEVSDLCFRLSHPSVSTSYGKISSFVASPTSSYIYMSNGVTQGTVPYFHVKKRHLDVYTIQNQIFYGKETSIPLNDMTGNPLSILLVIPKGDYQVFAAHVKQRGITILLFIWLIMVLLSLFLSRSFSKPITKKISDIRNGELPLEGTTGISEIDTLLSFVGEIDSSKSLTRDQLPPKIDALFQTFAQRATTLTAAEKNILSYYAEGYDAGTIAEKAYISMSTARKHSGNIYRKLDVSSRDDLMLYLKLFRQCNRLDDLLS